MTPERWRQIGDLFDAAVRIDPAGREAWLRDACGGDDDLRAEVGRLLAQDERADRDGFLTPPGTTGPTADRTGSWPPRGAAAPRRSPGRSPPPRVAPVDDIGGFTPRAGDRAAGRGDSRSPSPGRRAGAAARAADDLHPDPGASQSSGGAPSSGRRILTLYRIDVGDHRGPRGPHRPALEPVARPAGLAQGRWSWG